MNTDPQVESVAQSGTKLLEAPLTSLPAIHSALATTSMMSGEEQGGRGRIVRSECAACGEAISKSEIERLAAFEERELESSKSEIADGAQCVKCGGKEFRFWIQPESARHWVRVKERLAQTAREARELQAVTDPARQPISKERWAVIAGLAVVGAVLFFLLRYWVYGTPIPLVHQPQQYEFGLSPEVDEVK